MEHPQTLLLIDRNVLSRDCLGRALLSFDGVETVRAFGTVEMWLNAAHGEHDLAIIVQRGHEYPLAALQRDVELLREFDVEAPIILVSDDEDPNSILRSLDLGIRGYIPSSLGIDVAFEAMRLVAAGGVFVPASSLIAYRRAITKDDQPFSPQQSPFTARQEAVVRLLRQGKSNKAIASELTMRESTVKVHIRNIMRIMNAKSRTEIAVRTASMDGDEPTGDS